MFYILKLAQYLYKYKKKFRKIIYFDITPFSQRKKNKCVYARFD